MSNIAQKPDGSTKMSSEERTAKEVKELHQIHGNIHLGMLKLAPGEQPGNALETDIRRFSELIDKLRNRAALPSQPSTGFLGGEKSLFSHKIEKDGIVFVIEREGKNESTTLIYNFHLETVVKKDNKVDIVKAGHVLKLIQDSQTASLVLQAIKREDQIMDDLKVIARMGDIGHNPNEFGFSNF